MSTIYCYYKYVPQMWVLKKPIETFKTKFFLKYFHDFYEGKLSLYISPEYDSDEGIKYAQIALDLDAKSGGWSSVVRDIKRLHKMLDGEIEVVTTPNGVHVLGTIAYVFRTDVDTVRELMKKAFAKIKTVDWQGSFKGKGIPFGRLGLSGKGSGYMNPLKDLNKLTAKVLETTSQIPPSKYMKEQEWIDYIDHKLFPRFEKHISIEEYLDELF